MSARVCTQLTTDGLFLNMVLKKLLKFKSLLFIRKYNIVITHHTVNWNYKTTEITVQSDMIRQMSGDFAALAEVHRELERASSSPNSPTTPADSSTVKGQICYNMVLNRST